MPKIVYDDDTADGGARLPRYASVFGEFEWNVTRHAVGVGHLTSITVDGAVTWRGRMPVCEFDDIKWGRNAPSVVRSSRCVCPAPPKD